jgi:hypothetical protein
MQYPPGLLKERRFREVAAGIVQNDFRRPRDGSGAPMPIFKPVDGRNSQ